MNQHRSRPSVVVRGTPRVGGRRRLPGRVGARSTWPGWLAPAGSSNGSPPCKPPSPAGRWLAAGRFTRPEPLVAGAVAAWQKALAEPAPAPLAVLRIPRIRLEVAVLEGTDEFVLNRAVGHIAGTALPGADGNSGIAGHRDGFFRGLKDIAVGDVVEIETLDGKEEYRIERTWIVTPEDVSVLDRTPARSLTLVTCYPFYFIGSAPQRFIVRAVRVGTVAAR